MSNLPSPQRAIYTNPDWFERPKDGTHFITQFKDGSRYVTWQMGDTVKVLLPSGEEASMTYARGFETDLPVVWWPKV
jgi:hypothetical protein